MPNDQPFPFPGGADSRASLDHTNHVWVRRCTRCRIPDLNTAGGHSVPLDDTWLWRCPNCGWPDAIPVHLELPGGHGTNQGNCTHATGSGA